MIKNNIYDFDASSDMVSILHICFSDRYRKYILDNIAECSFLSLIVSRLRVEFTKLCFQMTPTIYAVGESNNISIAKYMRM